MSKNTVLGVAFLLALGLASLHFLADAFYLYWTFWWYDVLMHFFGGVTLGFFAYWLLCHSGVLFRGPRGVAFSVVAVLLAVFLIGVAWEVFEYYNGITDGHEGYRLDVVNDLVLDSCGAVLAALIITRRKDNG